MLEAPSYVDWQFTAQMPNSLSATEQELIFVFELEHEISVEGGEMC